MITIEDFKKKQSEPSRLIGLDLGSKRIGVSMCDEKQSIATPFRTINKTNTNELIAELKEIIKHIPLIDTFTIKKTSEFYKFLI